MNAMEQRTKAEQFRQFHVERPMLILPNVWDAASARVVELAGARAIATTSSGLAASLGYADGERMSRDTMIEATARIARSVSCPVTADIEAGYGETLAAKVETARAIIATGAVGFNIEDSTPHQAGALVALDAQVELIAALRALAASLDVPFVINARVDVFLRAVGAPEERFEQAVQRAQAYLRAGADCVYPIGRLDHDTIARLVNAIDGPVNILGAATNPPLAELERLGVARLSVASGLLAASLGHIRQITRALLERGDYTALTADALTSAELHALFAD
jgi:2-methylisocitrate lyase-like PEP mutase family enzyme